ncbi:hypothetical protein BKA65DRAFT_474239 [Rhexocercosporidium sp. MPI-PUGE-AT-0058]|nr:hypothetical protein BKA65DRAFT_474239 [Rhexocercosporidium sp. MPI-PUGE-AT-0058]
MSFPIPCSGQAPCKSCQIAGVGDACSIDEADDMRFKKGLRKRIGELEVQTDALNSEKNILSGYVAQRDHVIRNLRHQLGEEQAKRFQPYNKSGFEEGATNLERLKKLAANATMEELCHFHTFAFDEMTRRGYFIGFSDEHIQAAVASAPRLDADSPQPAPPIGNEIAGSPLEMQRIPNQLSGFPSYAVSTNQFDATSNSGDVMFDPANWQAQDAMNTTLPQTVNGLQYPATSQHMDHNNSNMSNAHAQYIPASHIQMFQNYLGT